MRFALAAVALAGAVMATDDATSTVYSTEYYTVTSCAAEVGTNCPASTATASFPPSGSVIPPVSTLTTESAAPACPTTSVKTIKTSITTVIPTIIYETVDIPCATETPTVTPSGSPTGANPGGPIETAGAATYGASALFAAAAGLFALMA
ncbi:hypothetical protein B0J18DRAFT_410292 [Chaetomium sp. MPI-SDFR-AT-0129]|uniref:GPI anchored serine-rich protein n=1 Tax=Dichotomopilus funicola TaxID=1934379 RepID=A0AAN6V9V7_9PEZI|nr:hypothetical protein B0J18DRAFT_410292 [Chaetomium sp. MPI-SDFR-AT-0129]KAK4147056.1 hypothetical protein C8A04DRAFT_25258 [Dichotomopilus funicola]